MKNDFNNNMKEEIILIDKRLAEADVLRQANPQQALEICKNVISQSEDISYTDGLAKAYLTAGICSRSLSNFDDADSYLNRALSLFREVKDIKRESRALNSIANLYYSRSDFKTAISIFSKCIEVLELLDDKIFEATVRSNMGLSYQENGDLEESLNQYFISLKIYSDNNTTVPHTLLNNIGIVYQNIGDYNLSLNYFYKALKLGIEKGNKLDEGHTLGNIGQSYMMMKDYANAITYLTEAKILFRKLGNIQGEYYVYLNLSKAFLYIRSYPEALLYCQKALKYAQEVSDKSSVSNASYQLGHIYFELKDFVAAKQKFSEGIQTAVEIDDTVNEVKNYMGMARLYMAFNHFDTVITYLDKALVQSAKRNSLSELSAIHSLYGECYKLQGDYDNAAKHLDEHNKFNKKLLDMDGEKKVKNMISDLSIENVYKNDTLADNHIANNDGSSNGNFKKMMISKKIVTTNGVTVN